MRTVTWIVAGLWVTCAQASIETPAKGVDLEGLPDVPVLEASPRVREVLEVWKKDGSAATTAEGLYVLGYCLFVGKDVTKNEVAGAGFFQEAAEMGWPDAEYMLGLLLLNGHTLKQNARKGR